MRESCTHNNRQVGICPRCGVCAHELVLNQACFTCGEVDLEISIKPNSSLSTDDFVPIESLRRKS